jgi:hypothetical protein
MMRKQVALLAAVVFSAGSAQAGDEADKARALYSQALKAMYKCGSDYAWEASKASATATEIAIAGRSQCAKQLDDAINTREAFRAVLAIERGARTPAALDAAMGAEPSKMPQDLFEFIVSEVIAARLEAQKKP